MKGLVCAVAIVSSPALADAPKHPRAVDLNVQMALTFAVSSMVANPAISPYDLIDSDAHTAWNSRTGDLVGAWMAVRVPPDTYVESISMTAGFDATGPEGDYFTLNHRIKRVAIFHDKTKLREVDLDITKRDEQLIPVDATGGDIKIVVVATQPGTQKTWREIAVSELTLMGTPPPNAKGGVDTMAVGSLDAKPLDDPRFLTMALDADDSIAAYCKRFIAKTTDAKCESYDDDCVKAPSPPTCGAPLATGMKLPALPFDWKAKWFASKPGLHRRVSCNLAIESDHKTYVIEDFGDEKCGAPVTYRDDNGTEATTRRSATVLATAGPNKVPLVVFEKTQPFQDKRFDEVLVVCGRTADGGVTCGDGEIGGLTVELPVDGNAQHNEREYAQAWSIKDAILTIKNLARQPDVSGGLTPGIHPVRL